MLIANRGEIALRILRTCREMEVATILAHSEADADSLPARLADQTVCVGPGPAQKSYLNIPNIIAAASAYGAEAIHPGYGFLSENTYFAEICTRYGLVFVGPSPAFMEEMGNKLRARKALEAAGVPVLPGSKRGLLDAAVAEEEARSMGYPVILKACGGGGGRGLRVARDEAELRRSFSMAQREAEAAFGNRELYLEKYLAKARHVEVQVLADQHGAVASLGERECSLQRRHQKLMEETPCVALSSSRRRAMEQAAVAGMRAAGLSNAGTVEFLLAPDGSYYFLEVNARLQVEHGLTEMVTGVDLVKEQLRMAAGERLRLPQTEPRGHAIECRVTAEDASRGFAPQTGAIEWYRAPGGTGVRVDSHLYSGYVNPPYYDSLLAKVLVVGNDRDEALRRMRRALGEMEVAGVRTTLAFLRELLDDQRVVRGETHTTLVEELAGP